MFCAILEIVVINRKGWGEGKRLLSKLSGYTIALSVGDSPMAPSKRLRPVHSSLYVATNKGLHVASFGPSSAAAPVTSGSRTGTNRLSISDPGNG